jgi:flagellar hook-associated protein 1 FlgK
MSLFSSIQLANNTLRAQQVGMQVVGQNIANANTPGYIREEVVFSPAPTQQVGNLLLGLGVQVDSIIQKLDIFLEERLRGASSDRASAETQEEAFLQLEGIIGELSDTDLSTQLSNFFGAIDDINNQPESLASRNLAVLEGEALADSLNRLASRVNEVREDLNRRVTGLAKDVNRLVGQIQDLNIKIARAEGSNTSGSAAIGLRDQRNQALASLSELIQIRVIEDEAGAVNVFAAGEYLVFGSIARGVEVSLESDRGLNVATVRIQGTEALLPAKSGQLNGLLTARDEIAGGYLDQLNAFAGSLILEFNQVFSSGQGLRGHDALTGTFAVDDTTQPLDLVGLAFPPVNGSFQVQVYNELTGLTQLTDIFVDLHGLDDDTTLESLAGALNDVDGITATIEPTRQLTITSDSPDQRFAFGNDTSGVLTSLGINTFFTGTSALDVGVNDLLLDDAGKFSASTSGIGTGSDLATHLAGFADEPLDSQGGDTLNDLYHQLVSETTQAAAAARSVSEGFSVFEETLAGQKLAISGVSLDEEVVRLISFQQTFQAAARYISTLNDLLQILVSL